MLIKIYINPPRPLHDPGVAQDKAAPNKIQGHMQKQVIVAKVRAAR